MRHSSFRDRALQAREHGEALSFHQPDADDRDRKEQANGLQHTDGGRDQDDHPQLSDEEHDQQGEHPQIVPFATV